MKVSDDAFVNAAATVLAAQIAAGQIPSLLEGEDLAGAFAAAISIVKMGVKKWEKSGSKTGLDVMAQLGSKGAD